MVTDLHQALTILRTQHKTCVLCHGREIFSDHRRGIRPLLELLDSPHDLRGFCAADKVVGKAAAFLYQLLGISQLHACVLSEGAGEVLTAAGISFSYDTLVPAIQNRTQTGLCPMESAVRTLHDPIRALEVIRQTLAPLEKDALQNIR